MSTTSDVVEGRSGTFDETSAHFIGQITVFEDGREMITSDYFQRYGENLESEFPNEHFGRKKLPF